MEDRVASSSTQVMDQEKSWYEWNTVDWKKTERQVFKLQKRIYQASRRGDRKTVHRLQRLLTTSRSAKLLATRKVTQDNRGKRTAGVDGRTAIMPSQRCKLAARLDIAKKPSPVRRIWIPKPGKKEQRPLGIPTIEDRAKQALVKLALEPEWEAKFEPNNYGFRPGRSSHDAIEAIFGSIKQKNVYVLDADIEGCFDNINHQALLEKMETYPKLRRIVRHWLKVGYVDNQSLFPTKKGTPQGGVISPLLANRALHGIEQDTKEALYPLILETLKSESKDATRGKARNIQTLSIIRYADDFIVMHESLKVVEAAQRHIEKWLARMGLALKQEKTQVVHTLETYQGQKAGFDFLGFHVRQYPASKKGEGRYQFKSIIKPSDEAIKRHIAEIQEVLRKYRGAPQVGVISKLNPIIRGWANYYGTVVSRKVFERTRHILHQLLWRWASFRHPHKGDGWRRRKYFRTHGGNNWRFMTHEGKFLMEHIDTKITRHRKVAEARSPYDGDRTYWSARMGRHPDIPRATAQTLKRQGGRCWKCREFFKPEDILEEHHIDGNRKNNRKENFGILHGHCHDEVHGGMNDKHHKIEEPDDLKESSPVLKPSILGDKYA